MKPYYENENGKLYHGDCLEVTRSFKSECIDLTVTSPPYDNLRKYKGFSFDYKATIKELFRITKKGGVVVWVVSDAIINGDATGTSFKQALYFKEVGFNLNDTMIFEKLNPLPTDKRYRYYNCFEFIFIFSKGRNKTFNPIYEKTTSRRTYKSSWGRKDDKMVSSTGKKRTTKKYKIKKNIFSYAISKGGSTKYTNAFKHTAIFPEKLAEDQIISWSNPGDIVLDLFMGSGTTGKMAEVSGRSWIGCDESIEYCEIAAKRIEAENRQLKLF